MPALYTDTSRIVLNPDTGIPADYPVENSSSGIATNAIRGLKSAITNYDAGSAASDYYKAAAAGDVQRAGLHAAVANRLAIQANRAAPRVQSVGDIHGLGDAADWGAGVLGAAPVSMVGPLGAGLAAGIVARRFGPLAAQAAPVAGSVAGMYPDMRDAARLQQMQSEQQGAPALPAQQVLDDTSHQGAVQAALEGVVPGLAARSLVGQGAKAALSKPVSGALQRIGRDTALDAAAGAGSELVATQYESGRNPGRDTSGDAMRYIDAAAGEAVVGGGFGALGHAGDMAHTALSGAAGLGVQGARAGGELGMDLADRAWANRPKSAAEAAIALGTGAAKLRTSGEDMLTRAMQHGKDADVDALLSPQTGMAQDALMQDDAAKHAAAGSLLDKMAAQPDAYPAYVREAAAKYAATKRDMDAWRTSGLADAVNDWKRSEHIGEGFTEFSQKLALTTGKAMAKAANAAERLKADAVDGFNVGYGDQRAEDGRANAQTPRRNMTPDTLVKVDALRDEFSPLLEKAIAPYTGLHAPLAQAENVGALAHGLREWIANGFAIKKNGKVVVPDGLLQMFKDPVGAVAVAHDLMQRQGIVGTDSAARMALVARHIEVKQEAVKHIGSIVEDNIPPLTQEAGQFSGAQHKALGRYIRNAVAEGKPLDAKIMSDHFGHRAKFVEDAFRAKYEAEHASYEEHQPADVADSREGAALGAESVEEERDPNNIIEAVKFHHYRDAVAPSSKGEGKPATPYESGGTVKNRDGTVTYLDKKSDEHAADLSATNGSSVRRQGYADYLRELHGDDNDAFMQHLTDFYEANKHKLPVDRMTPEERMANGLNGKSAVAKINEKFHVLREEQASDAGEGTDIHAREFDHLTSEKNKWAEFTGRDNEYGSVAHGKIWFERADGEKFATSAAKIINRMIEARKKEGTSTPGMGMAGQHEMLLQGIASMLASAHRDEEHLGRYGKAGYDGVSALKPKVGFMATPKGRVIWNDGEKMSIPGGLRMKSAVDAAGKFKTFADARKAAAEHTARVGDREAAKHASEESAREAAERPDTAKARASADTTRSAAASALKIIEKGVANMSAHLRSATDLVHARTIEGLRAMRDTDARQQLWDQILPKGTLVNVNDRGYIERNKYISTIQKRATKALTMHDNEGNVHVGRGAETASIYAGEEYGMRRSKYEPAETPQGEIAKMGDHAALNRSVDEVRRVEKRMKDGTIKVVEVPWPGKEKAYTNEDHTGDSIGVPMRQAVRTSDKLGATSSGSVSVAPPNAVPTATDPNAVPGVKADSVRTKGAILTNPVRFDKDGKVVELDNAALIAELHHAALIAQLKGGEPRYNAMATKLHTDLGREGFGATHDSPIRHEGKFDWRAHQGKGEGNAAFGAGTYLSTDEGVHKSYKNQFTAKVREAGDEGTFSVRGREGSFTTDGEGGYDIYLPGATAVEKSIVEDMLSGNSFKEATGNIKSRTERWFKLSEDFGSAPDLADARDRMNERKTIQQYIINSLGPSLRRSAEIWNKKVISHNAALVEISAMAASDFVVTPSIKATSPTYEVSVDIKPEQLLDWDAPISEQSDLVQKALNDVMKRLKGYDEYKDPTGKKLYHYIEDMSGGSGEASDYLQSLGILGHKYAAAGGKNDAHPNYVIYDDSKITTNYVHFSNQNPKHGMFGTEGAAATEAEQTKFVADAVRRLGPSIQALVEKELFGTRTVGKTTVQIPISGDWTKGVIRASLFSHDLGQIGAHEAMHEFFSRLTEGGADKVKDVLLKAANSAPVVRQLERLLDGQTAALAQIANGAEHAAEERLAYMFQFHQAGLLTLGPETQTVFQKIWAVLRKVAGILNDDQQADMLLRAFNDGKAQTADAANAVLSEHAALRKALYSNVNAVLAPAMERGSRLVNTAETNMERTGNPVYHKVRTMFKRSVGESGPQGYLDAKDHQMKQWFSKVADVFDGLNPKDLELAATYLHTGAEPTDRVAKDIVAKIKGPGGILPAMHQYLKEAGVQLWVPDTKNPGEGSWQDMGHVENYYPRAYDTAKILANPGAFITDLLNHNGSELQAAADAFNADAKAAGAEVLVPKTAEDVARAITNRLTNTFGQAEIVDNIRDEVDVTGKAELKEGKQGETAVGFTPFMQSVNRRSLHWISPEILAKYGEKDVAKTVTSYVAQAVKRAEYVRRFGNTGEKLQAMLKDGHKQQLARMLEKAGPNADVKAIEEKALKIAKDMATDVMAMEGTLGYNISPTLRKINNSALVYENVRVLSTSLFSQLIDPMGMVVRGATMGDAWNAYKRGMREVVSSIKNDTHVDDRDSQIAGLVGTVDSGNMLAAFGQLYSSQYMGATFRKANDLLFKYNGMEGFNRGVQVSATRAAIGFIKRHAQKPGKNSEAYLAELNLKASDVTVDANGELDYSDPKIKEAIHQWVGGAVLRPNAAQRPAWGSDPHYMMFWHMKQFAYTFHDVILKRAVHDYKKFGDLGPAGILVATFTPIMIAADAMKSILLTGSEPTWMKAGLASELEHGAMRAGLAGKFQPALDVMASSHRSVLGLGGPVVEQITQAFTDTPHDTAINALPGANLWNTIGGKSTVDIKGD